PLQELSPLALLLLPLLLDGPEKAPQASLALGLRSAAAENRLAAMQLLLARRADPRQEDGAAALVLAARPGHLPLVQCLLDASADADREVGGRRALHAAAEAGRSDVVDLLLARHANAEALSCNGSSPLALAARAGHVDCMKVLLKAAASSSSASTLAAPLQEAAKRNHPDAVELLLDHKAAVDSPPGSASALQLAVQQGHLEVARQLLRRGAATGRTGKSGAALLHSAVQLCQAETLRLLLDSNADVDQPMQDTDGDTGCTALHLAAQQGFEEGLRLLLDANARADLEMRGGFTPLALAARAGHGACCQLLCEGAGTSRVDAKTAAGWTPLLLACKAGHVAMARQLLDAGASVNLPSTRGRTPLMASLESEGGFWLAELLLKRRAALDPALPGGWTALHLACHLKSTALPLLLAAAPEEVWRETEQGWTPLHVAAQSGDVRSARALLRSRASSPALSCKQDPGIPRSRQGFCTAITPLHIAAEAGHEEMVRLLLQEGASPNAVAERRASPLHLAAGAGGSDVETAAAVAEALLEHGAEVDAVMDSGATALMVAARQGREAVARVLLRHGAELRRRLPNGWCSFLLAVRNGHAPVVRLLLKPELLKVKTPAGRTPLQCAEKYGHSAGPSRWCSGLAVVPEVKSLRPGGWCRIPIQKPHFIRRKAMGRRFLFGVSLPFILATAEQLSQCSAADAGVDPEELPLEEDSVEFSLLQTSLTLSQREPLQLRHAKSLLSAVVDAAPWHANGSAALNTSSPLALLSSVTSITARRTRDVIAWPGACVLGLSFVVTLIFVVVLWAVMLEASQASKALATGRSSRQGNMPARLPEAGPVPKFGGESVENSLNARIAKPPPICPSLSLLQGAAQFRIPLLFLDKLRAGTFPMQILGPSGKPLLHAWLPLCSKSKRAGQRPERQELA
ncbi:unnamed protein product, partial [Effrenium voratum]